MNTTDPEVTDVIAHQEALRTQSYRNYVHTLRARGLLKHQLDAAEASDVLLTMVGSDASLNFTGDRHWSVERYVAWTINALDALLLPHPNPAPDGPAG